jgi:outer membrane protein assembly factor BamD
MNRILTLLFIACILFLAFGCAKTKEEMKPADVLFSEASQLAKKGNVEKAVDAFMQVRTYYPGHELARKSLLATADLYYDQESYEEALKNYEEFRLLYPTNSEAGYSLYRIAMCHYKQMGTYDRDQTETVKAIQSYETFLKSYPNSPYVTDGAAKLKEARKLLATHYIAIGKFYLKKNKPAACNRFKMVKRQFSDLDVGEDVDALIARACSTGN